MKIFRKLFRRHRKKEEYEEVTAMYRCPQCGKETEITTCLEYKQLYDCVHCGRTMLICHGRTIGYK